MSGPRAHPVEPVYIGVIGGRVCTPEEGRLAYALGQGIARQGLAQGSPAGHRHNEQGRLGIGRFRQLFGRPIEYQGLELALPGPIRLVQDRSGRRRRHIEVAPHAYVLRTLTREDQRESGHHTSGLPDRRDAACVRAAPERVGSG